MCGRYSLSKTEEIRERFFESDDLPIPPRRHNVCPEQLMPVIVGGEKNRRLQFMNWELIPSWAKDPKSSINARIEGILAKPTFEKSALYRRCLVPACGFYEWK